MYFVSEKHNLIIIGNSADNSKTSEFVEVVPLNIKADSVKLGQCSFQEERLGVIFLAPHSDGKLALILLGTTIDGLRDVVTLASPTIPPMTRSPVSSIMYRQIHNTFTIIRFLKL